jgi:hypothetical protein
MVSDLKLSVGRSLMARVATIDENGRGTITLAGATLEAELPKELQAGQEIRLMVRDLTPERVVLQLQDQPPAMAQPVTTPLPGGGTIEVRRRDQSGAAGAAGGDVHTLSIVYDAPALGAIEMSFALDPSNLRLQLTLAAGEPFELAQAASDQLSQALSAALAQQVSVVVRSRYEPVEIYA